MPEIMGPIIEDPYWPPYMNEECLALFDRLVADSEGWVTCVDPRSADSILVGLKHGGGHEEFEPRFALGLDWRNARWTGKVEFLPLAPPPADRWMNEEDAAGEPWYERDSEVQEGPRPPTEASRPPWAIHAGGVG